MRWYDRPFMPRKDPAMTVKEQLNQIKEDLANIKHVLARYNDRIEGIVERINKLENTVDPYAPQTPTKEVLLSSLDGWTKRFPVLATAYSDFYSYIGASGVRTFKRTPKIDTTTSLRIYEEVPNAQL